jgi:hypothetical protein
MKITIEIEDSCPTHPLAVRDVLEAVAALTHPLAVRDVLEAVAARIASCMGTSALGLSGLALIRGHETKWRVEA